MRAIFPFLSGEWMLTSFGRCANGGGPVLVRSVWVTALLFGLAIILQEWGACTPRCALALDKLPPLASEKLSWLAAIFSAVYSSLYACFASQWLYLAGVFNQIMSAKVGMSVSGPGSDPATITRWQAGFIEDADDLHLATTRGKYAHLADDPVKAVADRTSGALAAGIGGATTVVRPIRQANS